LADQAATVDIIEMQKPSFPRKTTRVDSIREKMILPRSERTQWEALQMNGFFSKTTKILSRHNSRSFRFLRKLLSGPYGGSTKNRWPTTFVLSVGWVATALLSFSPTLAIGETPLSYITIDQGSSWTKEVRKDFYSRDQGSRLIPLSWMVALKQSNGKPFLEDSLSRYGYLVNDLSDRPGLPVGFTVSNAGAGNIIGGGEVIGMTCSACHTRQITANQKTYRIDGGPALVDFQSLLTDLDKAVDTILTDQVQFSEFAKAVLGPGSTTDEQTRLQKQVADWFLPYHTIMSKSLPTTTPWGLGRLDAIGMIFNRITGLDIGTSSKYLIPENIRQATAPARYPYLWNSQTQDKTQWPGVADNGSDILGLARNLGQVYGVFAEFHPKKASWRPLGIHYLDKNSASFSGLHDLEEMVKKIGPPKFPGTVDTALASKGKEIFELKTEEGGCKDCHAIAPGETRFFNRKTWLTPLQDVGTDSRQYGVLEWKANPGVLKGASILNFVGPLGADAMSIDILKVSVLGSILQHYVPVLPPVVAASNVTTMDSSRLEAMTSLSGPQIGELNGVFKSANINVPHPYKYESRVLQGVWAAAPYLHNGSVRSLAELLEPAERRASIFEVGPEYDLQNLGLAKDQPMSTYSITTTDCSDRNSGNSRCGHEFGTQLNVKQKAALLEYLKIL
jgi:hypothetical protein